MSSDSRRGKEKGRDFGEVCRFDGCGCGKWVVGKVDSESGGVLIGLLIESELGLAFAGSYEA